MRYVDGDLIKMALAGEFDIIVHGANCYHTMGAGIAAGIRKAFPEAYLADRRTAYGSMMKLGKISTAVYDTALTPHGGLVVINAYTQFEPNPPVDYNAVSGAIRLIGDTYMGR